MTETITPRTDETIDTDRLAEYLSKRSDTDRSIDVFQFPAGSSNLTYLVTFGEDEFVLRRPPFGNTVKTAHDMRREFNVLSKLSAVYAPAPKPRLFCDDESVIGSEFYLMERRNGLVIRGSIPSETSASLQRPARSKGIITSDLEGSQSARIAVCESFMRNLADLHLLDFDAAGLGDLGRPEGYNRRQVEGWTKRYQAAKTDEHAELERAIEWLNADVPTESRVALIHNDYKFDNVMLDPDDLTSITAVLDWEMVTVGDPLMDLGTTLGYWMSCDTGEEMLSMPFNPRVLMENISRSELVETYVHASGREASNLLFYYVFGTFKIAVIAQQIYARFVRGHTADRRFAGFGRFVKALGVIAAKAIEKGKL